MDSKKFYRIGHRRGITIERVTSQRRRRMCKAVSNKVAVFIIVITVIVLSLVCFAKSAG